MYCDPLAGLHCRREQLKKEGKLLTGKAKAEAERLAAMRAQMLKQAEEKGAPRMLCCAVRCVLPVLCRLMPSMQLCAVTQMCTCCALLADAPAA
jgi:hypothetical protein